ncbi:MAG: glycosyltransferase family 4 protein [Candidatus Goldbacteria bacterium]|nr:glycosyltransferase family 4 protein [Candidatus Goldiibacteriota bacterium]
MSIILISYDFYPNIGGVAQHVLNLGRFLSRNKNEVYVFTIRNSLNQKFFEYLEGVKIFRFFSPNISKIRGLFFLFQSSIFGFLFSLFKKIDIVHSHTIVPDSLVGLFLFSKRKIFTNHSSQFLELYDDKNKIFIRIIYKFIMKFYDFIIAPSEELKEKSIKFFNFKKDKVFFISNGVDVQRFRPINIKEKYNKKLEIFKFWNLDQRKYLIFCPRRLEPKNGVEFFVKAIQLLIKEEKNFWALISGNEYILSYANFIKNLIKELNLENYIFFTGSIPNEKIIDYYQASDIVVLPSLMEAVSISGLEALACGIPVIGTKVGGIPFIISDKENGLLVEPKNYYQIYESILYLIKNDKLRFDMSKKSRQLIENNFSWDKIVLKIESIYKK